MTPHQGQVGAPSLALSRLITLLFYSSGAGQAIEVTCLLVSPDHI